MLMEKKFKFEKVIKKAIDYKLNRKAMITLFTVGLRKWT